MNIDKLIKLIKSIKGLHWWAFVFLFLSLFIYLFSTEIKYAFNRYLTRNEVTKTLTKSELVNNVLRQMMQEFMADRAFVYRFHNGVNYYDGTHKIKSSMDFEVVAPGIQPIGLLMQDVPVSLFADQMAAIVRGEVMGITDKETKDIAAGSLMRDLGTSHSSAYPFYDEYNRLILVVGVDWVNKSDIVFFEDRFKKYVEKVGRMLTNKPSEEIVNIFDIEFHRVRAQTQIDSIYYPYYTALKNQKPITQTDTMNIINMLQNIQFKKIH